MSVYVIGSIFTAGFMTMPPAYPPTTHPHRPFIQQASLTFLVTHTHPNPQCRPPHPPPPPKSSYGTLLGDYAVGKSSLFQRYVFDNTDYYPTIGVDFQSQSHSLRGHTVRLQLWDTAGQERFRSIIQAYVRNVFVCFLVFDVTRRVTFEHLDEWIRFVEENNTGDYLCVVVANKVDKPVNEWQVLPAEMDAFVQDKGLFGLYLVSANAGLTSLYKGPRKVLPNCLQQLPQQLLLRRLSIPNRPLSTKCSAVFSNASWTILEYKTVRWFI